MSVGYLTYLMILMDALQIILIMQPRSEELFSEQLNNIENRVVFPNTTVAVRTTAGCVAGSGM
jgi:hypothetical protein